MDIIPEQHGNISWYDHIQLKEQKKIIYNIIYIIYKDR